MKGVEASIRATNITPFDEDVKLFYTGTGAYALETITDNKIVKKIITGPSNWGPSLQNTDGTTWVNDGKTFPYAFNAVQAFTLKYLYGATLYTATRIAIAGQPIEDLLRKVNEDIAVLLLAGEPAITTIEEARGLNGASPIGVEMYYNNNNLVIDIVTSNDAIGDSFQSVTIAGYLLETNFSGGSGPDMFFQPNALGWNIAIIIRDLQGGEYRTLVNSLLNQPIYIDELRQYSRSSAQVLESLQFIQFNVDGNIDQLIETNVIDPYQAQPTLDSYADILLDGQTYCKVKILAGESLELRLIVEEGGALTYEDLKSLDDLLAEQGVDMIYQSETKELEETWNNFDGFKENKEKDNKYKILIIAILALLIIK
tara:strand:+ start:789 stop:1898 length:1110 start_codon:yes stop_codon:yes gene_type:complete